MDDILLTCQSIEFKDGYPVLGQVFRHLAHTPSEYVVWVESSQRGTTHLLVQHGDGLFEHYGDWELLGVGQDYYNLKVRPGFEGGIEIALIDAASGNARVTRSIHFGGLV